MSSLRLVVISIALTSAVACSSNYSSPSTSPSPSPAPTPGGPAVSIPVGASVLGTSAYAPDMLNVDAGATVTWTNTDSVAHTSTSDAARWDSGIVQPGGQFSVAFPTAGTYQYHCAIHPGMIGTVVVR